MNLSNRVRTLAAPEAFLRFLKAWAGRNGQGLALAVMTAMAAAFLSQRWGAPPMLLALLLGMAFYPMSQEAHCKDGLAFASGTLLRAGVALLGLRVELADLAALGVAPFAGTTLLLVLTIGTGLLVARLMGRDMFFGLLAGGAVAICGASAALAIAAALPAQRLRGQDVIFTVVGVTSLSSIAMVLYPILFEALGMSDRQTGFLIGATIHDVAQVAAAGYSHGVETGDTATLVKLSRVIMLPLVLLAVAFAVRTPGRKGFALPPFVIVFGLLLCLNSLGIVPEPMRQALVQLSSVLLLLAIAALGARTSLPAMFKLGVGHLAVPVTATLVLLVAAIGWAVAVI
ncbi:putative sulfate exporter family transporter [Rhodobacteraceae bacterium D3-12]|nr:putative sulfate exporter family transporter [Rhodobacteraceae bacterium D3-12]